MSTSEKAQRWFEVCDLRGKGKISAALAHAGKVRVLAAAGGDPAEVAAPKKPGDEVLKDTFIKDIVTLIQKSPKESDAQKELDAMISEAEVRGQS